MARSRGSSPPGPTGLPIIGNALQIPKDRQWLTWDRWAKIYGDVIEISVLGHPSVILSSLEAAVELLETRGNIYSGRPNAIMAGEMVGWARGLGYTQASDPRFKAFRRVFQQSIGPRACSETDFVARQEKESRKMIRALLKNPGDFRNICRDATSSYILLLSYAYDTEAGDPLQLVNIAEHAMNGFSVASEPGRWWVDSFPVLRHVPPWVPGAGFQRAAKAMREDLQRLYDVPFNFVKQQITNQTIGSSFVSDYLEQRNIKGGASPREEEFIKAAAASLYSGGAETTPSALVSFILAMTLYPDIQRKAQAELTSILGDVNHPERLTRLPRLSDRDSLPYISAIVKEVWRWNPSVPLGLPHVATEDDVFRGYLIRKGTTVWANIWSILHDEHLYPEPFEFKPERFLGEDGKLPRESKALQAVEVAFGFGRRICPGMYLAENSVFLGIANILTVFHIEKAVDAQTGEIITPEVAYDGFISHPKPFQCSMVARSELSSLFPDLQST